MADIKIELPMCDQYDKAHAESWAYRMCAPCSLWTVIKHYNPEFKLSPEELKQEMVDNGGYVENVGFKHHVIAETGAKYGIPLTYSKKFFYTPEEKEVGMQIINTNLRNSHPVLISMYSHFTVARGGHMVVVQGFQELQGQIIGYYVQSSDATFRGHNYFVMKEEFVSNWRGGLIYQDELVHQKD